MVVACQSEHTHIDTYTHTYVHIQHFCNKHWRSAPARGDDRGGPGVHEARSAHDHDADTAEPIV
jgi:hypothetical protein